MLSMAKVQFYVREDNKIEAYKRQKLIRSEEKQRLNTRVHSQDDQIGATGMELGIAWL